MKHINLHWIIVIAIATFAMGISLGETHAQNTKVEHVAISGLRHLETVLSEIEFSASSERIKKGESVLLRWNLKRADEAILWKNIILPLEAEPIDWWKLSQLGQKVKLKDELKLTPEETTAYYMIAKTPLGMAGKKIVVEVVGKDRRIAEPFMCTLEDHTLKKMEAKFHFDMAGQTTSPVIMKELLASRIQSALTLAQQWNAPQSPPVINMSANPEVIFEDESTILTWSVSNANNVVHGSSSSASHWQIDLGNPSGTKQGGGSWGGGGAPPCTSLACMSGQWNIDGQVYKQHHFWNWVKADNVLGKIASAGQWIDILSIPQFKGAYTSAHSSFSTRKAWIRDAIKTLDKKLRDGCILYNTSLDNTVDAFKHGHLSRQQVWANLLKMLQNMKLVTFKCEDVFGTGESTKKTAPATWQSYTNEIILRWKPDLNLGPWEYTILHELVHKSGFHDDLLKYYSGSSIENQTDMVASACFP